MAAKVLYEVRDTVAVITLDHPPVNALGAALRSGLAEALARADADESVSAVVLTGAGRCFSGGADIREFGQAPAPGTPPLPDVIDALESGGKPVVAAVHGVALGGGCEVALGCHYRVGAPDARVGLPEVKIGLIPGAGGTQRLPRLIGLEPALDAILAGEPLAAGVASEQGFFDTLVEGDLVDGAVAFAADLVAAGKGPRRTRDLPARAPEGAAAEDVFEGARSRIARRARGLIAPFRCIESVENTLRLPFDEGLARERELFMECRDSDQSKAQRHVFFAERQAAKVPGLAPDVRTAKIASAGVIGFGTMGRGIAVNFANAGIPVKAIEVSEDALEHGMDAVRAIYDRSVRSGRMSAAAAEERVALIQPTTQMADLATVDIVIEAVVEEMGVKKTVFAALDEICKPGAILATNTSTLDVDEIATAVTRPESVVGTHFFSPANVMKLVENVRGARTDDATVASVMRLSKTLGKVGVLVGVCDGFVGNRMYYAYTRQANFLLEEGALPQQVDKALYDFGFAMGPFAVGDLSGLDIGWQIRQRRAADRPADERYAPVADRICERGRYGQKTGAGWYRYAEGSRKPEPDPAVEALILERSAEMGIARREISDQEVVERCLFAMVNEGAHLLEEGIAARFSDIDVVWLNGYGFPVHQGGPMFYADRVGLARVHEVLAKAAAEDAKLTPAPLIVRYAEEGRGFAG